MEKVFDKILITNYLSFFVLKFCWLDRGLRYSFL